MRKMALFFAVSACVSVSVAAHFIPLWAENKSADKPTKKGATIDWRQSANTKGGESKGKWYVSESVDEITDDNTLLATLRSCDDSWFSDCPMLIVRVKGGELDVFVKWDWLYEFNNEIEVILRFDGGQPVSEQWNMSTSHDACFSANPHEMLESLRKHSKLVVRIVTSSGTQKTATFDIRGLNAALKPYWKKYFEPAEHLPVDMQTEPPNEESTRSE